MPTFATAQRLYKEARYFHIDGADLTGVIVVGAGILVSVAVGKPSTMGGPLRLHDVGGTVPLVRVETAANGAFEYGIRFTVDLEFEVNAMFDGDATVMFIAP